MWYAIHKADVYSYHCFLPSTFLRSKYTGHLIPSSKVQVFSLVSFFLLSLSSWHVLQHQQTNDWLTPELSFRSFQNKFRAPCFDNSSQPVVTHFTNFGFADNWQLHPNNPQTTVCTSQRKSPFVLWKINCCFFPVFASFLPFRLIVGMVNEKGKQTNQNSHKQE